MPKYSACGGCMKGDAPYFRTVLAFYYKAVFKGHFLPTVVQGYVNTQCSITGMVVDRFVEFKADFMLLGKLFS